MKSESGSLFDLRRASQTTCRPRTLKNIARGALVALAMGSPLKASPSSTPTVQPQSAAFTMAGYKEYGPSLVGVGWLGDYQAQYIKESAELQAAMDACAKNAPTCDPQVKAFANMIDLVKQVPDQLTQIEMIKTYVNTINYDYAELMQAKAPSNYRTLKQALDDYQDICKENAELEAFALKKVGFKENNVHIVFEAVYVSNIPTGSHAVTAVRIGNQTWIMNDSEGGYQLNMDNYSQKAATNGAITNSTVETDAAQLNFSGHSATAQESNYQYVPTVAFNTTDAHFINGFQPRDDLANVPLVARNAPAHTSKLSLQTLEKYHFLPMMLTAFAHSYQTLEAEARAEAHPPATPAQAPAKAASPTQG
ncbi:MAG: transglutaminase-like domain-containing protein [Alphaproteobacteria bacterium]